MNYLFIGQESYLKEKAIVDLRSKLLPRDSCKLNFNIYYAGIDSIKDILSCANTLPFSGKFRIIVIRDVDKFNSKERGSLLEYLKRPSKEAVIILDSDKGPDGNQFAGKLARFVKLINFKKPKGRELDNWIREEASSLNKKISKEAIDLVKELVGTDDLTKLKNELEKAGLFAGNKHEISKSDIKQIIGKSANEDIFELIEAISRKDAQKSFDIISDLILRKTRPHEIIGLLAWHFRKSGLKKNIELLLSSDLAIKRSRLNPKVVLELTILELCR